MRGLRCGVKFLELSGDASGMTTTSSRLSCRLVSGGASVTQVAQRHEIRRQQIYAWRHDLKKKRLWSPDAGALFYPVDVPVTAAVPAPQLPVAKAPAPTAVEVRLRGGHSLHFNSTMDTIALTALIRAVEIA